jgi:DNA invertase Pin-like site-specific DNA recombinase
MVTLAPRGFIETREQMMANALVVRSDTQLAVSQRSQRAAEYVRMSTDYQRYSIENQAVIIAAYAQAHGLTIVRTYSDKGESGLKLRNRGGLIELLDDVQSGNAEFGHILVFDVSRWGRFQDIDESAHYEFICKKAGVKVTYCAEQFANDDSMLSSIVKNLKRVMAAEYSRELSSKVYAGACRYARMGFAAGGPSIYGLHRVLVDEKLQSKGILRRGDRKYLTTDHVRFRPGADEEIAVVKWIFNEFLKVKSEIAIARRLNRAAIPSGTGGLWDNSLIGRLIRDERYIGNLIYNRRSHKLGDKFVSNPPDAWIRSEGCIEPIVDLAVFLKAKAIIEQRRPNLSDEEMLTRLRRTLAKKGRLTPLVINGTAGMPSSTIYIRRFGSLRKAYSLIGYTSGRDCSYIDSRQTWADLTAKLTSQVATRIEKAGGRVLRFAECLRVDGSVNIFFRIARWVRKERGCRVWSIQSQMRPPLPTGWIAAIRLAEDNEAVLDYVLLPITGEEPIQIRFSERVRIRRGIGRFETSDALIRSIIRRVAKQRRAFPTKPQ